MGNARKYPIRWRIEGPFDSTYSLALLNRELARALASLGVEVALHSTEGPGDFDPSPTFLTANDDLKSMHERSFSMSPIAADVSSRNLYPPRVADMCSSYNLLHSYAWEESSFPSDWVRDFNSHLSGMTCLSEHVKKVMQDNGVHVPMAVSGCGVDHWERVTASSSCMLDNMDVRTFKFLHVSSFFPRKGAVALLEAYGKAFSQAEDVTLIIKTFPNPHNRVHDQLSVHRAANPAYPHVVLIEDDLSDSDLKALYERCDVLVAPSCAEGFGMPLAQAMLSGIPVITTGWSGQLEFCNESNTWLVDYLFEQAVTHFKLLPSAWAAVDRDALATTMRKAVDSSPEKRKSMAQNGRVLLLESFTWKLVAERLVRFYQQLRERPVSTAAPKVGWVSTWNVKCGIATYSGHLIKGLPWRPTILAARNANSLNSDDEDCVRCWDASDTDDLAELSAEFDRRDLDCAVIQFNFGFFHHDLFTGFIARLKSAGRAVVVDMHATIDPPQDPRKRMKNYVPALAMCDRLLVHTIADMNRMKAFGLVDKLVLFPHGIIETPTRAEVVAPVPTIATYGFCLPHKGLSEVLQAVTLLRDAGKVVKLKMINAEYPIDISADLVRELKGQIEELGLEDQVMLESRFLPDSESIALLQSVDLIVFAYHPTPESVSGATHFGLASRQPTLVTNLPIFEELGETVWRVEGNSPGQLAHGIWGVLEEIRSGSALHKKRILLAKDWQGQHQYARLSERLGGMIISLCTNDLNPRDDLSKEK